MWERERRRLWITATKSYMWSSPAAAFSYNSRSGTPSKHPPTDEWLNKQEGIHPSKRRNKLIHKDTWVDLWRICRVRGKKSTTKGSILYHSICRGHFFFKKTKIIWMDNKPLVLGVKEGGAEGGRYGWLRGQQEGACSTRNGLCLDSTEAATQLRLCDTALLQDIVFGVNWAHSSGDLCIISQNCCKSTLISQSKVWLTNTTKKNLASSFESTDLILGARESNLALIYTLT